MSRHKRPQHTGCFFNPPGGETHNIAAIHAFQSIGRAKHMSTLNEKGRGVIDPAYILWSFFYELLSILIYHSSIQAPVLLHLAASESRRIHLSGHILADIWL
jgi:hypothetical protein